MKTLGIGLIGSGFMGRCHVNAYNSIASIFKVSSRPVLKILADATPELASQQAKGEGGAALGCTCCHPEA